MYQYAGKDIPVAFQKSGDFVLPHDLSNVGHIIGIHGQWQVSKHEVHRYANYTIGRHIQLYILEDWSISTQDKNEKTQEHAIIVCAIFLLCTKCTLHISPNSTKRLHTTWA